MIARFDEQHIGWPGRPRLDVGIALAMAARIAIGRNAGVVASDARVNDCPELCHGALTGSGGLRRRDLQAIAEMLEEGLRVAEVVEHVGHGRNPTDSRWASKARPSAESVPARIADAQRYVDGLLNFVYDAVGGPLRHQVVIHGLWFDDDPVLNHLYERAGAVHESDAAVGEYECLRFDDFDFSWLVANGERFVEVPPVADPVKVLPSMTELLRGPMREDVFDLAHRRFDGSNAEWFARVTGAVAAALIDCM